MSEVDPKNRDDNTIFNAPNNRTFPSGDEPLFLSEAESDVCFILMQIKTETLFL